MMATQNRSVKNSQDQESEIKEILEKMRQRDSLLFIKIIDAIHDQDEYTSRVLANEVAEIRKAMVILENASADILHQPKCPDLLLCPICCSPEISISQGNSLPKCHCLDCGKNWIAGIDNIRPKWIENVWSLA
ncbi:MAG: hypothetical protein WBV92_03285 [Nitrosotalea sp.]